MASPLARFWDAIVSLALPIGIIMLLFWTASVLTIDTPGWVHLFLTLGTFFVIWGIVRRGDRRG